MRSDSILSGRFSN